jgi:hypothetical protein
MSTKIYYGIRIPIEKISQFTKFFDDTCLIFVEKSTRQLMSAVKEDAVKKEAELLKGIRGNKSVDNFLKDGGDQYIRFVYVAKMYMLAMKTHENWFNPESWFNAFPFDKHFYIIPGYPTGLRAEDIKYPDYVEDYSYWDNTDPPDNISNSAFRKRGKVWEKCGAYNMSNRLCHTLIEDDPYSCTLSLIENRILTKESAKHFSASYVAKWWADEKKRSNNIETGKDELSSIF